MPITATTTQPDPFVPSGMEGEELPDVPEMSFGELFDKVTNITFSDVMDVVNPLQHIPIVSTAYREITGDEISTGARIAGGALYGGPVGVAAAGLVATVEEMSGESIEDQVAALFADDPTDEPPQPHAPAKPDVQVAELPPPSGLPAPAAGTRPERKVETAPPAEENVAATRARIDQSIAARQDEQAQLILSTVAEKTPVDADARKGEPRTDDFPRPVQLATINVPAADTAKSKAAVLPSHPWVLPPAASPAEIGHAMDQALRKYQKVLESRAQ